MNQNADRYIVREVRGMGLGAGGFEVVDTLVGRTFGVTIWRDGAELLAARCNAMDRALLSEDDAPTGEGDRHGE